MIEKLDSGLDLKKLNIEEKKILAEEIRKYIIEIVSKNGGHLASNLGVVELTIALHSIFDLEKDRVVWDVGHQTYVHKILTGRKESLKTLRQLNGIAGFPKTKESITDAFNTGHSSTSISVALGMAIARDIKKENKRVLAVIGDGALTGGMALEALNDAGAGKTNITVILNDNEMSISKNIGGLNMFLSKLRTKKTYTSTNINIKEIVKKVPIIGKATVKIIQRTKRGIKQMIIPKMFFEDIGFRYLGPVDGNDLVKLESLLKISKNLEGPVIIHVLTKKGKGYLPAEENPDKFHATSPFDIKTGLSKSTKSKDYSKVFGDKLVALAKDNDKIVAITASMKDGTGLKEFQREFPDRFFDVGIAEQHAVTFAAGLSKEGIIPVVPIYSSFYQRAYDQVIHDIAIQKLPVVLCVDRAGIVGNDGETHQGILDMSFFRLVPNLVIMAPKDFNELENMLEFAINIKKPVVIRYPRGSEEEDFTKNSEIENKDICLGKAEVLKTGEDVTIIAIGKMVSRAYSISNELKKQNINAEVINIRFLKPFDKEMVLESINKTKSVITIEDGTEINGLGTTVKELIVDNNLKNIRFKQYSYPDEFISHGSVLELEKIHKLDKETILNDIKEDYKKKIEEKEKLEKNNEELLKI